MAKCEHCGFPYATSKECPNCKSKNPKNTFGIIGTVILIIIGVVAFLAKQKNDRVMDEIRNEPYSSTSVMPQENNSNQVIDSSLSQNPNGSDEREMEIMESRDTYDYICKQCGKQIKWQGSYTWTNEDNTSNSSIDEITDLQLKGDDRMNTEMYHDEGHTSKGLFCSDSCARKSLNNYLAFYSN